MKRLLVVGVWLMPAVCAQGVLNTPKQIDDARTLLDTFHGHAVSCDVVPIPPHFNFTLRLQAGYVARLPVREIPIDGQKWVLLTRITPRQGDNSPVYLSDVIALPPRGKGVQDAGNGSFKVNFDGSFWLGEGSYRVKWMMFNSAGGACRKEWRIDAHLKAQERKIGPLLPPNTVAGVTWNGGGSNVTTPVLGRLTIVLHAASLQRGESLVGRRAKGLLLDALLALMQEMPAESVRLVIFNLDQQKEIWRRDAFTLQAMADVAKALDEVPWAVDYQVLQNSRGKVDLVESLANQEIHAAEPSDTVIFLGPHSIYSGKPSPDFAMPPAAKPQFFYLLCGNERRRYRSTGSSAPLSIDPPVPLGVPPRTRLPPDPTIGATYPPGYSGGQTIPANHGPDIIQSVIDQLGGKVLKVDSPDSFATAVAEITRRPRPADRVHRVK